MCDRLVMPAHTTRTTDPLTAAANVVYSALFEAMTVASASLWWRLWAMTTFSAGAFVAMLAALAVGRSGCRSPAEPCSPCWSVPRGRPNPV